MTASAVAAGFALLRAGEGARALEAAQALVRATPDDADGWNLLGLVMAAHGEASAALRCYDRALALDPGFAQAHNNRGGALADLGRAREALGAFQRALELAPGDASAWDNLLLAAQCVPELTPEQVAALHFTWGRALEARVRPLPAPRRASDGPLRVGYVSADLRRHPVASFFEPVLAHHDRDRFRVHVYANRAGGDEVTARLRGLADVWREIDALDDEHAARAIARDGVDVLIDLSGHTAGNRLGVFARRPAPVQMSWLGYPATTGLSRIDHRLTDDRADPPGTTEALHTEALLRLPATFLCFAPPASVPVAPPPSRARGAVTFGSFNHASKLSERALDLWARVLASVPGARLLLKARGLDDAGARAAVTASLARRGVEPARVELRGFAPTAEAHLRAYDDVDVALDTHPYAGTTTTCEALWMGVPVVTRLGRAHVARVGGSLLAHAGLDGLAAADDDAYVAAAAALAAATDRREALRATLRERLRASALMDGARFTRSLEAAYRGALS